MVPEQQTESNGAEKITSIIIHKLKNPHMIYKITHTNRYRYRHLAKGRYGSVNIYGRHN